MEMARSFQTVCTDNFQFIRWKNVGVNDKLLSVNETDASHMKRHCVSVPKTSIVSYPYLRALKCHNNIDIRDFLRLTQNNLDSMEMTKLRRRIADTQPRT